MLAKKRKKGKTEEKSFLDKLYAILSNDSYSQYIHWSPDGLYIIISDPNGLSKKVLPEFYKHHNFSSFVRQLNMYNFTKVRTSNKREQKEQKYMHKEFNESKKAEEIKLIKKKKLKTEPKDNDNLTNSKNCSIPNEDKEYVQKIEQIENLDEDSKIKEYKKILKNEELTNLINEKILNYLINKSRENNDSKRLIENEINNLTIQNNDLMKQLELLKNKLEEQKKISKKMKAMIMLLTLLNNKKILNTINFDLKNLDDFEKEFSSFKAKINPFELIDTDSEEEEEVPAMNPPQNPNFCNPNKFSVIPAYIYNYNMYSGISYPSSNLISRNSLMSIDNEYYYDRKSNIMNYDNINNINNLEGFNNNEYLKMKQIINNSLFLNNSNNINNNNINNSIKIQDSIYFSKNQNMTNILYQGYLYKKNNSHFYEKKCIIIDSTPKLIFIDPEKNIIEGEILLEKSIKVVIINKKEFKLVIKDKIYYFKDDEGKAIIWEKVINDAINKYSK